MPEPFDFPYDLFISCTKADLEWVQGFLLPALGLPSERVISNQAGLSGAESFQLGAPIPEEFERAVKASRYTMLILSPAYLADEWATFSEQLASYATVAEQRNRLIPVEREKCELPLHIEFRVRLDCTDKDLWEAAAATLRDLLNQPEPEPESLGCPYPGMKPFEDKYAGVFFGREADIDKITPALRDTSYLWIIGNSGSGKSSLIVAGVKPALAKSKGYWLVRDMRPGKNPTEKLALAIGGDSQNPGLAVENLLAGNPPAERFLLVIDQFEEMFTQAEPAEQVRFVEALKVLRRLEYCVLLMAMRADFYGELINIKPLMIDDLWPDDDHKIELTPLRGANLLQAIHGPANDRNVYLEKGLVERLVADTADEPGFLPFLQETMWGLWEKRQRRLITSKAYEDMGSEGRSGLAVAIARKATGTLDKLTAEQKAIARRIFLRLVQFGEGRANTRRQQTVAQLDPGGEGGLFQETLAVLVNNRLLTQTAGEQDADKKVDISHESLITGWPRLGQWLETRRELEKFRRGLEEKANEWLRRNRQGGWLHELELIEAEHWLQSPDAVDIGFGTVLIEFVQDSWKRHQEEQQRWQELYEKSEHQRQLAMARQLAAESELIRGNRGSLIKSTLLAVESLDRQPTLEGDLAIRRCLELLRPELALLNHGAIVTEATFSPDGEVLATASWDKTARLWDRQGQELARLNQGSEVSRVAFSPYGEVLATASWDKTAWLWDRRGKELARLTHEERVVVVGFSPDGQMLATASWDKTARLWDRQGRELARLKHDGRVYTVSFSPDGQMLATASEDKTARLWDRQGRELAPLKHDGRVYTVSFSPDGQVLATASYDKTARLWDRQGRELACLKHENLVYTVSFSKDGEVLATASNAKMVRLWDRRGLEVAQLNHEHKVTNVAFSLDGDLLATSGMYGRTVQLWDRQGRELAELKHDGVVRAVAFSPDGQVLATASEDKTARLWDRQGRELARLHHEAAVTAVKFSPDGQVMATVSEKTARLLLWRPEDLIAEACRRLPRNLTQEEWRQYLGEEPYRETCGKK